MVSTILGCTIGMVGVLSILYSAGCVLSGAPYLGRY